MRAEIVIYPMKKLQIIGSIPVVDLLADIRILILRKGYGVISIIGNQLEFAVYDSLGHFRRPPQKPHAKGMGLAVFTG